MAAQSPQRLLEVRDTLLAVVLEEAARWQNQTIDAWCTLQRDLARHAALSAAVAAEETMDLLWPPSAPRTMRAQPAWNDESSPLGDETFKAWERLWLPWVRGADTPSRA
jgi:hypothetical protein